MNQHNNNDDYNPEYDDAHDPEFLTDDEAYDDMPDGAYGADDGQIVPATHQPSLVKKLLPLIFVIVVGGLGAGGYLLFGDQLLGGGNAPVETAAPADNAAGTGFSEPTDTAPDATASAPDAMTALPSATDGMAPDTTTPTPDSTVQNTAPAATDPLAMPAPTAPADPFAAATPSLQPAAPSEPTPAAPVVAANSEPAPAPVAAPAAPVAAPAETAAAPVASAPAAVTSAVPSAAPATAAPDAKVQELLTLKEQQENEITRLQAELREAKEKAALAAAAPAPVVSSSTSVDETATAAPVVKKAKPAKPKTVAAKPKASGLELRAASDGTAWVAPRGSNELRRVAVGDSLPGVGRIKAVREMNGKWVIQGTTGQITQ